MKHFRDPWLVIGAKGMLGIDLMMTLNQADIDAVGLDVDDVDITQDGPVQRMMDRYRPGLVINVAALTDVDACESKQEETFRVNARGPENLARACRFTDSFLLHMSTDYVFDGRLGRPYLEDDPLSPLGVYGKSKALGEHLVRANLPDRHCILRTQWLFGVHGKNFVESILALAETRDHLKVVNDQYGRPTYSVDLADAIVQVCDRGFTGTLHVANSGEATWHHFARKILELSGIDHVRLETQTTEELGRPAPRPAYSVLDISRFAELVGSPLRHWEQALSAYLDSRPRKGDGAAP
ncbi:MAG: dTDP-4-dehydrorhamnose reductase [Thermodesulfobacteriota bacterium]